CFFFFQAEDGIRDPLVTGVQTCALPILTGSLAATLPAAYRLWLGGSGAWAGVVSLGAAAAAGGLAHAWARRDGGIRTRHALALRSEERRVGKAWRAGVRQ